ncbi:MAG: Histidine ammonia-lyase [Mesotoga infera]|uniref:Histidine ammonia-lyase n=2 Tax=Mesotoga infera TaxID=1236046 RepID=A0A124G0W8_9BACT|nr:MAG: Histidine ammonia-lyase [Mesotoga infera]
MQIDGEHLRLSDIFSVAFDNEPCTIEEGAARLLDERRKSLEIISKEKTIYGVNTGFGILADHRISPDDVDALQKNIVLSHAAGVGEPVRQELVRAIMLVRANSLLKGYSGVRKCVVQRILDLLNNGITPLVPEKGSVGASGDLAPLAHIAMTLIGEGECFLDGKVVSSSQAMERKKLQPLVLKSKEGLSLLNGTAFMAGIGACATHTVTQLFAGRLHAQNDSPGVRGGERHNRLC